MFIWDTENYFYDFQVSGQRSTFLQGQIKLVLFEFQWNKLERFLRDLHMVYGNRDINVSILGILLLLPPS